jgi:hypothetical protein
MTFSYGERKTSPDQHEGRWIEADTIRKGDVISGAGPGSHSYGERYVDEVIGYVTPEYSSADYGYRVLTHNVAAPHIKRTETFVHFPGSSSNVYLVKRLTTQEDVERLERELFQARAALDAEQYAERERRLSELASQIRRNSATFIPRPYALAAAEALLDAGLLKD